MIAETVDNVEIPEFAICFCPLKGAESFMKNCVDCEFHVGLIDFNKDAESFSERYRNGCAAVMPRKITVIEG